MHSVKVILQLLPKNVINLAQGHSIKTQLSSIPNVSRMYRGWGFSFCKNRLRANASHLYLMTFSVNISGVRLSNHLSIFGILVNMQWTIAAGIWNCQEISETVQSLLSFNHCRVFSHRTISHRIPPFSLNTQSQSMFPLSINRYRKYSYSGLRQLL